MQDMQYVSSGTDSAQLATVQQGYKLYVNKCGSCHYLYRPHKFSDTKWKAEMPEMAEKAKINEEETKLVLNYLLTISEVELTKATAGQGQKYKKVVQ